MEKAIAGLSEFNLSADEGLEIFYGRKDEIGLIAEATHNMCTHLRAAIEDIGRILSEIADGNLSVDINAQPQWLHSARGYWSGMQYLRLFLQPL